MNVTDLGLGLDVLGSGVCFSVFFL